MFFGLHSTPHVCFFFINFSLARFFLYALCQRPRPPHNFSNGPSLKNNYYMTLTVYCIFFNYLAFCQLKTLQMLLIILEDVALQC